MIRRALQICPPLELEGEDAPLCLPLLGGLGVQEAELVGGRGGGGGEGHRDATGPDQRGGLVLHLRDQGVRGEGGGQEGQGLRGTAGAVAGGESAGNIYKNILSK